MAKYVSGRQKNLKVGIKSYSENLTTLEVIGKVGIGTNLATSKLTVDGDGLFTGVVTASSFSGDGSKLTGVIGQGSGVAIRDDGSIVGTAVTINFGSNLSVDTFSSGTATVTSSVAITTNATNQNQYLTYAQSIGSTTGLGVTSKLIFNPSTGNLGIGTTNPTATLDVLGNVKFTGVVTATTFYGSGIGLTGIVATGSGVQVRDDNVNVGTAATLNFGVGLAVSFANGVATVDSGAVSNVVQDISNSNFYYPILSPVTSGTISSISVSNNALVFNPSLNRLGIGTTNPQSKLHIVGDAVKIDSDFASLELSKGSSYFGGIGIITNAPGTIANNDILIKSDIDRHIIFHTNGANERLRITSTGNVGVGTTNPTSKLTVQGDVLINGITTINNFLNVNVKDKYPLITNNDYPLISSRHQPSGQIIVGIGITDFIGISTEPKQFWVFQDTVLSVGTTSVKTIFGQDYGRAVDIGVGDDAKNIEKYIDFGGYSFNNGLYPDNQARIIRNSGDDGDFVIQNRGTGSFRVSAGQTSGESGLFEIFTRGSRRVRVDSSGIVLVGTATSTGTANQLFQVNGGTYVSGNLGIGTTNPTSKLTVQGDGLFTGVVTAAAFRGDGSLLTGVSVASTISISQNATNQNQYLTYAQSIGSTTGLGVTSKLIFNPSTGNLGIGTTNPTSKLTVQGDGLFTGVVTAAAFRGDGSLLTGVSVASTISISQNATNENQYLTYAQSIGSTTGLGVTSKLIFNPSTGNLGIGTTNPTSTLDVVGDINTSTDIKINGQSIRTSSINDAIVFAIALG